MTLNIFTINDAIAAFNEGRLQDAAYIIADLPIYHNDIRDNPDYHQLLGVLAHSYGKLPLAVKHLKDALNRNPRRQDICTRLGQIFLLSGDPKSAAYYLEKARQFNRFDGREDVYVFGDSHSNFLFSGIPRCKIFWLGPMTMHRVGRDGLAAVNIKAFGTPEKAAVVFVFGEIDIRAHITHQRDHFNRPLDDIINTLCRDYIQAVQANHRLFQDIKVIITSVPPPLAAGNNPDIPFSSNIADRVQITRQINSVLERNCKELDFNYLDIFQFFSDPSGVMSSGLSDDIVHVRREFSDIVSYALDGILQAD